VGFLEVVIGPNKINLEEEKIKAVLEWPTPKRTSKSFWD